MGYEIDFLAVGDASKSGDAIALRWGDLLNNGSQFIAVIDGGFGENGKQLAELIREHYRNPRTIDLVVSTHPHADHIGGLPDILGAFDEVKTLWLHKPWEHNDHLASKFEDGRITDNSIGERLKESCEAAWKLLKKAESKGTKVEEPFAYLEEGNHEGRLRVLGPTEGYYKELLPNFNGMPETAAAYAEQTSPQISEGVFGRIERWEVDSIGDDGKTSAENNSSVILEFSYGGERCLFTADAGIPALQKACALVDKERHLRFIQIPHHGSRRNVGPTVLNHLVGEIVPRGGSRGICAYASCADKNPDHKHPNKRVLNAFTRRGCACYKTAGGSLRYPKNAPDRGYPIVAPCGFYEQVEDDE